MRKGKTVGTASAAALAVLIAVLGAMAEPPTSDWRPDYEPAHALLDAPLDARWKRLPGHVRHVFTHFPLELTVFVARVALATPAPSGMRCTPRSALDDGGDRARLGDGGLQLVR